jgi:hypothetical protein
MRIKKIIYPIIFFAISFSSTRASETDTISLNWLEAAPLTNTGISWGVPWPKNNVKKEQSFTLVDAEGKTLPLQSWALAYWPDGSVKWSGFSTVAKAGEKGPFTLIKNKRKTTYQPESVNVKETSSSFEINTGKLKCYLSKKGSYIIDSMVINNHVVASKGKLVCTLEDRSGLEKEKTIRYEDFTSTIRKITVEQSGPVRAVVKLEGVHKADQGLREWLPFCIRLYFYAGEKQVRMVHSIVFDGDEHKDFVKALGVSFSVPMREQVQNHHVRFSGEGNGLWSEPVQPLKGRDRRYVAYPDSSDVYNDQVAGRRVPNRENVDRMSKHLLDTWATWNDFKLVQPNADGFSIVKRTNDQSCWLPVGAGNGRRSSGLAFVGDVSGGLAMGVKNFWQSYPASLEIKHAATKEAEVTAWLWSPDAPAMDLRHYDTIAHGLEEVYEDVQPGFSTPNGIARTSELMLFLTDSIPSKTETVNYANTCSTPPLLVCAPQYLHTAKAFGIWSLPDRSSPFKQQVEDNLDGAIAFYEKSVEQNHWYGFWDFGDVMHTYDEIRHEWRYDLGGLAWDNSELGTDMWLWYSFLRTGRPDIFRMAEAMTRHTGEVDCYHLGRFAGLGSRHNVRHWGCGAKEARISQAAYRRFYYYLTTDERTGDIMHEMVNADFKATEYDPMRLAKPATEADKKYPGRVRGGPDWLAFVGNWMTEWERTGNIKYRDKIITGMESILKMQYWFKTGEKLIFGYDPSTGKLFSLNNEVADYNLATIMGGAEVIFELNEFIDHPGWQKAWLQYCRLTNAPADVVLKDQTTQNEGSDGSFARPDRLAAYAYYKTKNPVFAQKAYARIAGRKGSYTTTLVEPPEVLNPLVEIGKTGTNGTAQSSLIAIEVLEMCADQLPDSVPKTETPDFQRSNARHGPKSHIAPNRRVNSIKNMGKKEDE